MNTISRYAETGLHAEIGFYKIWDWRKHKVINHRQRLEKRINFQSKDTTAKIHLRIMWWRTNFQSIDTIGKIHVRIHVWWTNFQYIDTIGKTHLMLYVWWTTFQSKDTIGTIHLRIHLMTDKLSIYGHSRYNPSKDTLDDGQTFKL